MEDPAPGSLRLGRRLDEPPPPMAGLWLGLGEGGPVLLLPWWELGNLGRRPDLVRVALLLAAGDAHRC
jgi:hypothetical protein